MIVRKVLLVLVAVAALTYAGDNIVLRWRMSRHAEVFGSVRVDRYQSVPLKGGKEEYDFVGSEVVVCVRALFPHGEDRPCWYVERHREVRETL